MLNNDADLELELGATEVALKHLVSASGTFAGLISEVARCYTGSQTDPVEWLVEVRPGSVKLPVRGRPVSQTLKAVAVPEVASAIAEGLALLDARAERPAYFTDKALEQAKALANLTASVPIAVRNGGAPARLTKRLAANVDDVLGAPLESYGTVEGRLEGLNLHGKRPSFAVYEPLTGHKVECRFTTQVTLESLRPVIGRRVGIRGQIHSRPNGLRVSVDAREIRTFREADERPSPDEVRGILKGYV